MELENFEKGKFAIHCAESMNFMLQMPEAGIDCVITDPPYVGFGFDMNAENYLEKFYPYVLAMLRCAKGEMQDKRIAISQPKVKMDLLVKKVNATNFLTIKDAFSDGRGEDAIFMLRNPIDASHSSHEQWQNLPESKHPNHRDVNKIAPLIKMMSRPGETVFDPFCGSAAIGIAAVLLGRNYVGVELFKERAAEADNRLQAVGAKKLIS